MINLLPPEEKERILLEQKRRLVTISWFLVLFFLFCLVLILFSIKIYLQNQVEFQKILLLESEKEYGQSEIQNLRKEINSANLFLTKINSFYQKKIYFSEILEKISSTLPTKLYLTNFSAVFSTAKDTEEQAVLKVSLSGFASNRESLFEFKKNLEKESNFKEVYFPSANWVKPEDIDFSVSFKISP